MFNKGGNTIFEQMKVFQIREYSPQQILILPTMAIKGLQKNGTIWVMEHAFVWRIIYKQHVANMSIRIRKKENVKVFVENWFVEFIQQEMQISHEKLLIKHFGNMYRDFCFVLHLIKIIINIVTLACRPNIYLELNKAFFYELLQSRTENDSVRTSIEACCDQNFVQIKDHIK